MRLLVWASPARAEEEHALKDRGYLRNEILLVLERADFRRVGIRTGYADAEPTAEDGVLVLIATR